MAPHDVSHLENNHIETTASSANIIEDVVEAVVKVSLQDEVSQDVNEESSQSSSRPLRVYTRYELLNLSKSPLVKPPEGMPSFKDWFGDWNEQAGKKESDTPGATNPRDRRFRRDTEDGDSARISFRSGLSQPSQMGNFRHQSIRTTDRTGEKDVVDRERERDLRDREGQERLRNLSDKYDRDRLALSNLRNKERDAAPHLSGTSTTRLGQSQPRRGEGREASKRKTGDNNDDWRRGGVEPSKTGRDENRDTRERPRSRVRDSSRSRRESSTTRRDREDRDKPRDRRGDGDRDDRRDKDDNGRRDRDDYMRRDWDDVHDRERDDLYSRDSRDRYDHSRRTRERDLDRDVDDDSRHWRDDGRRDERVAARRGWDRFEDRDRERPSAGDDRDARTRRGTARDRRLGGNDDTKDREDRRDKEREAEPAWMETYIPPTPGGGILGGKGADGELDGIQAWKKGMKEKERKKGEFDGDGSQAPNGVSDQPALSTASTPPNGNAEVPMDEIQLFKLMMKREAVKKEEKASNGLLKHPLLESGPPGLSNSPSLHSQKSDSTNIAAIDPAIVTQRTADVPRALLSQVEENSKSSPRTETSTPSTSQPVLTTLLSGAAELSRPAPAESSSPPLDRSVEASRVVGPRMGQTTPGIPSSANNININSPTDLSVSIPPTNTFNPPPGSRVLALKSRVPSGGSGAPSGMTQSPPGIAAPHAHALQSGVSGLSVHLSDAIPTDVQYGGPRMTPSMRSFSPIGNGSQHNLSPEDFRESAHIGQVNEALRRASGSSVAERAMLGLHGPSEMGLPYAEFGGPQASAFPPGVPLDPSGNIPGNFAANKGSRFAKFFDTKTRDVPRLGQQMSGIPPAVLHNQPRQDALSLGAMAPLRGEQRGATMEDIFAMLQNSAQNHRQSPQISQTGRIPQGGGQFPQSTLELQLLQQQQQLHQQHLAQNRLDSLYDSRLDDRNFVPDGLVPGLRPAPPRSRSRESGGVLFNEQLDDPLHFNVQRLTQQRNMEQLYNASMPSMYNQQGGLLRNGNLPMQTGQFRGASPISAQNALQAPSRLPPGLANLGGRPPHDPSQYMNSVGMPGNGLHGATPAQQVYNTFTQGGLGFNGNPQLRGPPGPQSSLSVNPMGGLGNNLDLRAANQAQLLGLAQGNLGVGGMRGSGPGFGPQPGGQLSASHAMRQQLQQQQQQQQHLPPHMMPHILPTHLQQQQGMPGGNVQTTQDLMALLMGGHRE